MTLNEVNIIKNAVLDATEAYVDARLSVADFAKTQIGVIQIAPEQRGGKFYHTVVCNATNTTSGIVYHNVLSVGNVPFPKGSVVFLIAPNAQFSNQFILGKLDNTPVHITGGTIDIGDGNFAVDADGNVTIKKGGIYLNKTGNNYHLVLNNEGINLGYTSNGYKFTVNAIDGSVTIKNGQINLGAVTVSGNDGYDVNINKNGFNLGYLGKVNNVDTYNFSVTDKGKVTIKSGSINIADKFYVTDTGNLFIGGTTTSNANFYVTNTGTVTIKSGSWTIGSVFKIDTDGNLSIGGTSSSAPFYVESATGSVTIKKGSINIANKFYADNQGNLYIGGTTASSAKFYVLNTGYLKSTSGDIGGFTITDNSLGDAMGGSDVVGMKANDYLYAYNSSHFSKIEKGTIITAGDQGDPSSHPYCFYAYAGVNGSNPTGSFLRMGSSNLYSSNRNTTVAWLTDISDMRLKKNISEISLSDVRTFFSKIKPSKFKFKKEVVKSEGREDNNVHFGIVAQELKEALISSNLLTESIVKERKCTEDDDILTVNYSEFHGLELAGIKDLYNIVKDQQEQINALKALIKEE